MPPQTKSGFQNIPPSQYPRSYTPSFSRQLSLAGEHQPYITPRRSWPGPNPDQSLQAGEQDQYSFNRAMRGKPWEQESMLYSSPEDMLRYMKMRDQSRASVLADVANLRYQKPAQGFAGVIKK